MLNVEQFYLFGQIKTKPMVVLNKCTIFGQHTVHSICLGDMQFGQQQFQLKETILCMVHRTLTIGGKYHCTADICLTSLDLTWSSGYERRLMFQRL